jgi:hypothetical protein
MNGTPPKVSGDDGFDRFVRHCARFRKIAPLAFPRGDFKFRSVQEAQLARWQITQENARTSRSRVLGG